MSCGFGAVVLVFLIINHETNEQREFASDDVLSNNRQLDYQIQIENEKLEELKTVLSALRKEASQMETEIEEIETKIVLYTSGSEIIAQAKLHPSQLKVR